MASARLLTLPLLLTNLVLYSILLGLAAWAYDMRANGIPIQGENNLTRDLALIALITGVIGFSSVVSGLHHVFMPGSGSRGAAAGTSVIATALTLLLLGISSKHIGIGQVRSRRLRALQAFAIIPAGTQLLYTIYTYLMKRGRDRDHQHVPPATKGTPV